jgi:pimeloyl-ACP methyl ester carboxylesterase
MEEPAHDALEKWLTPAFPSRERFLEMQLAMDPEDYALGLLAIGGFDFRDRLDRILAPTLVIAGALDTATTPGDARFIAEGIFDARLVVLEGAAHLANVEQSAAFNAAVLEHLIPQTAVAADDPRTVSPTMARDQQF